MRMTKRVSGGATADLFYLWHGHDWHPWTRVSVSHLLIGHLWRIAWHGHLSEPWLLHGVPWLHVWVLRRILRLCMRLLLVLGRVTGICLLWRSCSRLLVSGERSLLTGVLHKQWREEREREGGGGEGERERTAKERQRTSYYLH